MRTGPKLRGTAVSPTQGKSRNQGEYAKPQLRGKAVAPTQGRTRNHPSVAPTPRAEIGKGVANSYFANSRGPVHKNFDTSKKHD